METLLIQNILQGEACDYFLKLSKEVKNRFNVCIPSSAPHFTIKYKFNTTEYNEVNKLVGNFVKSRKKEKIFIKNIKTFKEGKVIYVQVSLGKSAKNLYKDFYTSLEKLPYITWGDFDKENLNFHITLVKDSGGKCYEILEFLRGKEKIFDAYFDNISILSLVRDEIGNDAWKIKSRNFLQN